MATETRGFFGSSQNLPLSYALATVFLGVLAIVAFYRMKAPRFPTINSYAGDITLKKAHAEFVSNARGLIVEGIRRVISDIFLSSGLPISNSKHSSMAPFAL